MSWFNQLQRESGGGKRGRNDYSSAKQRQARKRREEEERRRRQRKPRVAHSSKPVILFTAGARLFLPRSPIVMTLKPGRVLHASSKKMHGVMQKNRNASGVKNANA